MMNIHERKFSITDNEVDTCLPRPRILKCQNRQERVILIKGFPPPFLLSTGCVFSIRYPHVNGRCRSDVPQLLIHDDGRQIACHGIEAERI